MSFQEVETFVPIYKKKPSLTAEVLNAYALVDKIPTILPVIYSKIPSKYMDKYEPNAPISDSDLISIEENNNFGHKLIWKGVDFPSRIFVPDDNNPENVDSENLYGENLYGGAYEPLRDSKNTNTNGEDNLKFQLIDEALKINKLSSFDREQEVFKLYRCGVGELAMPISTENPSVSLSLFKSDLDKDISSEWVDKYVISILTFLISFNYFIPNGSIRYYLDWYTLEYLKKLSPNSLLISPLTESNFKNPHDFEEGEQVSVLYARFDAFIQNQGQKFLNAYEKLIYYIFMSSKIYNAVDSDEQIMRNKSADLYIYKFEDGYGFTETINGVMCHISNGYIGQLIRYICLAQEDYMYHDKLIKRNKHFFWRDPHHTAIGKNDSLLISALNNSAKNSEKKRFNLITRAPGRPSWHDLVKCPIFPYHTERLSTIASIVQMTNFQDSSTWFTPEIYLKTFGMVFILNDSNKITFQNHRPPVKSNRGGKIRGTLSSYQYGIDEYVLSNLYKLDYFKNQNILYNNIPYHAFFYPTSKEIKTSIINKPYITAGILLFNHLSENLNEEISNFDFFREVETLRNRTDVTGNEKKWLAYLLSIYPSKYFLRPCVFNNNIYEKQFKEDTVKKADLINMIASVLKEYSVFNTKVSDLTWDLLEQIGLNCNTPIINSSIEWCISSYLEQQQCAKSDPFFSGFYNDKPESLAYGMFRNPQELEELVNRLDKQNLPFFETYLKRPDIVEKYIADYKITDSKDIKAISIIHENTFHPLFHALTWKLFICAMGLTKTNDNFFFMDSGNTLALCEYYDIDPDSHIVQYPWDDDIDIGFITDSEFKSYFEFLKQCFKNGIDVWFHERLGNLSDLDTNKKKKFWHKEFNNPVQISSVDDFDRFNSENIWFAKIVLPKDAYDRETSKQNVTINYKFPGHQGADITTPWIDVFPWTQTTENKVQFKYWKYINIIEDLDVSDKTVQVFKTPIKVADNITKGINKYKTTDKYFKKEKIYNHSSGKRYELSYDTANIQNFVKNYISEHHKKIVGYFDQIKCEDLIKGGITPTVGGYSNYHSKYIKYKKKFLSLY